MLVRALAARLDGGGLAPDPDEAIDLVALATVADAVPLVGDNRRRVAQGLRAMRERPRPGIAALCAAAGLEPRVISARALGFTLAPSINAAGRLGHPDRALELLLAPDRAVADPIGAELWALNAERREVEREIVERAIAQVEAEPDEIRAAGVVVASGDGWHEGVVGIVASRLVERFERPAIVLSRQGDIAKGSGRSVAGVDLHSLVAAASGPLTRWGGHAGAVGLELPAAAIARFRDELMAAAEGARAAIARARVRTVDAVVGGRDLTLATAEALEALAPFGRGNPPVRLVVPAVALESPTRVGQGQHLQVRIRSGGVHARAIGFRMGERAAGIDVAHRHDAIVELDVERWQGIVGPRVTVEALDPIAPAARRSARWARRTRPTTRAARNRTCGRWSPTRCRPRSTRPPPPARRSACATAAARAPPSAPSRRWPAPTAASWPWSPTSPAAARPWCPRSSRSALGVEVVVLGGARCDPGALRERLALARGVPSLAMLDYERLAVVELPEGMHIWCWSTRRRRARRPSGRSTAPPSRWLHLVWGAPEIGGRARGVGGALGAAAGRHGALDRPARRGSAGLGPRAGRGRPGRPGAAPLPAGGGARPRRARRDRAGRHRRPGGARGAEPRAARARLLGRLPRRARALRPGGGVPGARDDPRPSGRQLGHCGRLSARIRVASVIPRLVRAPLARRPP